MKEVEFVVDERGKKKAVLIDLKMYRDVWEDFCDLQRAPRAVHRGFFGFLFSVRRAS